MSCIAAAAVVYVDLLSRGSLISNDIFILSAISRICFGEINPPRVVRIPIFSSILTISALEYTGRSSMNMQISDMLASITYNDLVLLAANWLQLNEKEALAIANLSPEIIRTTLYETVSENNSGRDKIETLNLNQEDETIPLTNMKTRFLELVIRLGNSTWKAGQVHRAVWEKNTDRLNPEKREGVFDVDDQYRLAQFYRYAKEYGQQKAIIRMAFEFFKTLIEVRRTDIQI